MKNKSLTQINANLTQINADKSATICVQSARICVQEKIFKIFVQIILLLLPYLLLINSSFAQEEKFFEIRAKKFSYNPNIVRVNNGDLVKIRLISEDVTHGMFLDGYGINTQAHPGQEGYLEFVANKTGRYSFRCSVTCGEFHPYMIGYLVVEPNVRFIIYVFLTVFIGFCVVLFITLKKKTAAQDSAPGGG